MARELETWGGEVRIPRWIRRVLRRPPESEDTPERTREPKRPQEPAGSVLENADRAALGPVTQAYAEGRRPRR